MDHTPAEIKALATRVEALEETVARLVAAHDETKAHADSWHAMLMLPKRVEVAVEESRAGIKASNK
jgi:hypothetical protein